MSARSRRSNALDQKLNHRPGEATSGALDGVPAGARPEGNGLTPEAVVQLQRLAGNSAVARMLAERRKPKPKGKAKPARAAPGVVERRGPGSA